MDKKHLSVLVFSLMVPSYLMASGMNYEFFDMLEEGVNAVSNASKNVNSGNNAVGKKQGQPNNGIKNPRKQKNNEEDPIIILDEALEKVLKKGVFNNRVDDVPNPANPRHKPNPANPRHKSNPKKPPVGSVFIDKQKVSEKMKNYLNTHLSEGTGFRVLTESKKMRVDEVVHEGKKYYKVEFNENATLRCNNKIHVINGVGFKCTSGRDINICFDVVRGKCNHGKTYSLNEILRMKDDKLTAELTKTHLSLFYKDSKSDEDVEKHGSSVYGIYSIQFETVPIESMMNNSNSSSANTGVSDEFYLKIHCIGKMCTFPVKIVRLVRIDDGLRKKFLLAENIDKKEIIANRTGLSGDVNNPKSISLATSRCLENNMERLLSGKNPLKCDDNKEVNVKRMVFSGEKASLFSSFSCKKNRTCIKYSTVPEEYASCIQKIQWYPYLEEFKFVKEYDKNKTGVCVIPEQYKKTVSFSQSPVLKSKPGRDCSVAYTTSTSTYPCTVCSENDEGESVCSETSCTSTNSYSYTTGVCNTWTVYSWGVSNSKKIGYSGGVPPKYSCANAKLDDMTKQFIFYSILGNKRLVVYSDWEKWVNNILSNGNFFTILDNYKNYQKFIQNEKSGVFKGMQEDIKVVSDYCFKLGGNHCSEREINKYMLENELGLPSKAAYELNKNAPVFTNTLSKLFCLLDLHANSIRDAKNGMRRLGGSSTNFTGIFDGFQSDYVQDFFAQPLYKINEPIEVNYDAILRVEDDDDD